MHKIIYDAKLIFLNGTCGKYENKDYEKGTFNLLKSLDDSNAKVYVGGGDTSSAVRKFGFGKYYQYISSGGGVTLEYIAYHKLNALEWIKNNEIDS